MEKGGKQGAAQRSGSGPVIRALLLLLWCCRTGTCVLRSAFCASKQPDCRHARLAVAHVCATYLVWQVLDVDAAAGWRVHHAMGTCVVSRRAGGTRSAAHTHSQSKRVALSTTSPHPTLKMARRVLAVSRTPHLPCPGAAGRPTTQEPRT
jgi:hypothetical protein